MKFLAFLSLIILTSKLYAQDDSEVKSAAAKYAHAIATGNVKI